MFKDLSYLRDQHPLADEALDGIEKAAGSLGQFMPIYAAERQRLVKLIRDVVCQTSVQTSIGQVASLAARTATQGAFALPELLYDLGHWGDDSDVPLPGDVVDDLLGAGLALRRWQEAAQTQMELGARERTSGTGFGRGVEGSSSIERWYFPIDVLRDALPALEALLQISLGSRFSGVMLGAPAARSGDVLRVHDALLRLVFQSAWTRSDDGLTMVGVPLTIDELATPARFTIAEIAASAGVPTGMTRALLAPLTIRVTDETGRSPLDRTHPFRSDHPFAERPLVADGSDSLVVAEPFQIGSALVSYIERSWMASLDRDAYNDARSTWLEESVARCVNTAWGLEAVRNVKWSTPSANGELDVLFAAGHLGSAIECKSQRFPTARPADVSRRPAEQLERFDSALASDEPISFDVPGAADRQLLETVLAAPHQLRIVVLGSDFTTRTPSLGIGAVPLDVDAPLFLSLADLFLVASTLERDDAMVYLVARYLHRRDELSTRSDEEVFLSSFIEQGYSSATPEDLLSRHKSRRAPDRFGSLSTFLAWRNIFAAFDVDRPHRLGPRTHQGLKRLIDDLRASGTSDPYAEFLLRSVWEDIGEPLTRNARMIAPGQGATTWFSAENVSAGVLTVVGLGVGDLDVADTQLREEAHEHLNAELDSICLSATAVVVTLCWDALGRRARVSYLTDPGVLLHPSPDYRPPLRWTGPPPGRNDPCWCGSGQKFKRCRLGHHPLRPTIEG
ncbi:MAG: SEC-C domain-containing protein [Actinomycetota bacterium]|nr:SEC-C domain-containing protein [Actinomycetota bacterium]